MALAPPITCEQLESDGILIQMLDSALPEPCLQATLEHLHECSDCLVLLAKVLEMHGQVVVDHYWTQVRSIDPATKS